MVEVETLQVAPVDLEEVQAAKTHKRAEVQLLVKVLQVVTVTIKVVVEVVLARLADLAAALIKILVVRAAMV
jgi:hypothetical protein